MNDVHHSPRHQRSCDQPDDWWVDDESTKDAPNAYPSVKLNFVHGSAPLTVLPAANSDTFDDFPNQGNELLQHDGSL